MYVKYVITYMDEETKKSFETLNTRFDSLDIEMQNNNITIKEISKNILQNCGKLDLLQREISYIKNILSTPVSKSTTFKHDIE